MKKMFWITVFWGIVFCFNGVGIGATIYVDQSGGGYTTIQEGIDAADGMSDVNDIVKVVPGVYQEEVVIKDSNLSLEPSVTHTGPGQVEITKRSDEFKVKMTTEGIYYLTATVTDSQNKTYTDTVAITVMDKTRIKSLFNTKWSEMVTALRAGDIETAANYFSLVTRDEFRELFTKYTSSEIENIYSGIRGVTRVSLSWPVAECLAVRTESNGTYGYPVTFVNEDGIWMIWGY